MASMSRFRKLAFIGLGAAGGAVVYYISTRAGPNKNVAYTSWTTNFEPSVRWDDNWDHRHPTSLIKPLTKRSVPEEDNRINTELDSARPKATRHLFLIRHGQYYLDGMTDKERILTDLGRTQADLTGKRLSTLNIKFDTLVQSTMTRAQETGSIIAKHLPETIELRHCQMLEEGAPIPPEPGHGDWKPGMHKFYQDGARIEAAYRKYFHRASVKEDKDTYTLLVCHANVIRYFICRALQFPPEGWLRISLSHASITWLSILPDGRVVLRNLGDTGHMEPKYISSRNATFRKKSKVKDKKGIAVPL